MQIGAQRIIGEQGLPAPRREFVYATGGMVGDALQDIDEVIVRIDAMQAAGDDQALYDADVLGANLGRAEEPVFPAHRDDAQRALEMVGVHWYVDPTRPSV